MRLLEEALLEDVLVLLRGEDLLVVVLNTVKHGRESLTFARIRFPSWSTMAIPLTLYSEERSCKAMLFSRTTLTKSLDIVDGSEKIPKRENFRFFDFFNVLTRGQKFFGSRSENVSGVALQLDLRFENAVVCTVLCCC